MRRLAQATAYTVMLKLFLSSDHVSPATGKTVAIKISKNGGAFADPNAGATNATEVSNGWYKVTLDATDTGTLGDLVVRGTAASCDDAEQVCQVVSATTGGATNLDAAVSSRSSHSAADVWAVATRRLSDGTNIVLAKGTGITGFNDLSAAQVNAEADTALADAGLTTTVTGRIDAAVSTRLAAASYTAPDNAGIAAIKAKTDNLPSDPADQSLIIAATDSLSGQISGLNNLSQSDIRNAVGLASANLDSQIDALPTAAEIKTQVDTALSDAGVTGVRMAHLDADMSSRLAATDYTAPPSAASIAQAVWDALTSALTTVGSIGKLLVTNIDAAVTSRLASGSYTAPDNAGIAAVKERTDNLPDDPADQSLVIDATTAIMGRLGAPAGASLSADVAAVKTDTAAVKAKTDQLGFTGGAVDANIARVNGVAVTGDGTTGNEWGPV
ncbi:hypothetical protein [Mesorhizobium sp.]|uniref:hypothetical protein n=1 Tax=Mesorhizobium sp. TaxID=1871066 RepID=UPI00120ABCF8|nr:hypothetical protein [Mesorhizobium sp.]TIN84350.1 MAG: hypothetical protein E5X97_22545 [Mesorhizobium sp.]